MNSKRKNRTPDGVSFQRERHQNSWQHRKVYHYFSEGAKSENQYFDAVENHLEKFLKDSGRDKNFALKFHSTQNDTSVDRVIDKADRFLKSEQVDQKHQYEVWVIFDKDHRSNAEIKALDNWQDENKNQYVALSVPKFEYWLLLHFTSGAGIHGPGEVDRLLEKKIPRYDKCIKLNQFSLEQIRKAVCHARERYKCHLDSPDSELSYSTVYRLIESVLQFASIEIEQTA